MREELGFTQIEMAKFIGIPPMTYRMYEYNAMTPRAKNAKKIKDATKKYEQMQSPEIRLSKEMG